MSFHFKTLELEHSTVSSIFFKTHNTCNSKLVLFLYRFKIYFCIQFFFCIKLTETHLIGFVYLFLQSRESHFVEYICVLFASFKNVPKCLQLSRIDLFVFSYFFFTFVLIDPLQMIEFYSDIEYFFAVLSLSATDKCQ